jgi:hypothetical protein
MRSGFSATSAFGALLVAAGAVLLCTRLAQVQSPNIPLPWWATLALELGIYAALLALFDVPKSAAAYPVGVVVVACVRWGIVLASAAILSGRGEGSLGEQAMAIDRSVIARLAAMVFAIIVLLPLRDVLQAHPQAAEPAAAEKEAASEEGAVLLFGARESGLYAAGSEGEDDAGPGEPGGEPSIPEEAAQIEGSISLPAEVALKNVPPERIKGEVDPGLQVEVPLSVIVPQLKEARIAVKPDLLSAQLPPGTLDGDGSAVELPLDKVVMSLPAEVLERPKAAPPAWAQVEAQFEELLFTAV